MTAVRLIQLSEAHLRVSELGDIIHTAPILLPLSGKVQHPLALHAGPLVLQPDIPQVVGELEGVGRCVCAISFLRVCRRSILRGAAICLLLSLQNRCSEWEPRESCCLRLLPGVDLL